VDRETRSSLTIGGKPLRHWIALLLCALLSPACGGGSKKTTPATGPTIFSVAVTTPVGIKSGLVNVAYSLLDPAGLTCGISVQYSTDGGTTFHSATSGPGGEGTRSLASAPTPGIAHIYQWNSMADGVGLAGPASGVVIQIVATELTSTAPAVTSSFTVNNSTHTAPSASLTTPVGTQGGLVSIAYTLVDADLDPCSVTALFSTDGGATFSPATPGPGCGTANLASGTGGGAAQTFVWNSVADGVAPGGPDTTVQFRLIPADGMTGGAVTTPNFTVDNTGRTSGSSIGGVFPARNNASAVSDWAVAKACDGQSLFVFGFEGFDFTAGAVADSSWRLQKRILPGGTLDAGFGVAGSILENPGAGLDMPSKVLVDGGYVYLVGARETGLHTGLFGVLVEKRRVSDGALSASFGSGGVLQGASAASMDGIPLPWCLAVDASFLYLAGTVTVAGGDLQWHLEKRDKTTGALVASFGTAGAVEVNPTGLVDGCFGIVTDGTSLWLVGAQGVDGVAASNGQIRIEKRKTLDGSLVAGFGTGGVITVDAGPGDDLAEDVVTDGISLFVYSRVETSFSSGIFSARVEKRSLIDGSLSQPAVTGGASDPTGALPCGHLAVDGTFLYVSGADNPADCRWRIEKRLRSDLSLVSTFGSAGVVTINPAVGAADRPLGVTAAGGVLYVAGMDSVDGDEAWRIEGLWR
jgi:hypothetical protein